jgi:hypothetical protein
MAVTLDAIAVSGRPLKPAFVLRTEFARQSLDAGRTRNLKKQYRMPVGELKTDEELYERTPKLYDLLGAGSRMADPNNEEEQHELALIEDALDKEAWKIPCRFRNGRVFDPDLIL